VGCIGVEGFEGAEPDELGVVPGVDVSEGVEVPPLVDGEGELPGLPVVPLLTGR